ncbi:uncharacterized protein LOC117179569 [Belonocnema kinseyi]|uniref:uncharacterized protein LOC117179569 n=1 Tax=Belonocnema kinseyi TaxID=2817044 RepID=UPI00143DC9F2|nr:uncharacterized protein LOC117179569 [Belonocnema kinseyi]
MDQQFSLSLLILGAALSLGFENSPGENNGAVSVQYVREKRTIQNGRCQCAVQRPAPIRAHDIVGLKRGLANLGNAYVIHLHYAVIHADQLDHVGLAGLEAQWNTELLNPFPIDYIYHPGCANIQRCNPNVALIYTRWTFPTSRRQDAETLFRQNFNQTEINWATEEMYYIHIGQRVYMLFSESLSYDGMRAVVCYSVLNSNGKRAMYELIRVINRDNRFKTTQRKQTLKCVVGNSENENCLIISSSLPA